jgi:PhnB protein
MTDQATQWNPGLKGVTPYLSSKDAAGQLDFYKKAFAAEELGRMPAEDGKRLMHSMLKINDGYLMMSDCFPEHGYDYKPPQGTTLHLQVDDPQAWFDRAAAAGCSVTLPMQVMFWGDRYGQLKDPYDVTWSIGGPA